MHEMRKSEFYRSHSDSKKDVVQKHDREKHKILSNQSSYPTTKSTDRDHRPVKHKVQGAIRVCGEWSEHISSGGKRYYYHNKRESSQWEKPTEWNNSRAVDVKRTKSNASSQHKALAAKQSSSGDLEHQQQQQIAAKLKYQHSDKQRHVFVKQNSTQDSRDRDYRNLESSNVGKDRDYRDIDYRDSSDKSHRQDKDYRQSNVSGGNSDTKAYTECNGGMSSLTSTPRIHDANKDSPNTSLSGDSLFSNHQALLKTAEVGESNGNLSKTEGEKAALVQKLSSALSQANSSSGENSSSQHLKNALQLLLNAAVRNQSQTDEGQPAEKRQRVQSQSDYLIGKSALLGDPLPSNIATLQYFYEEQLALQSLNLPAETLNRQCQRMMGDSHNIHVHQTSQLGTQLKISRSQVRAAEIHATLQEQRILYLQQQIKDLDKVNTESPYT